MNDKEVVEVLKVELNITPPGTVWHNALSLAITAIEENERLREALKKFHHPFSHDYIKNEKKCPTCRLLARPDVKEV